MAITDVSASGFGLTLTATETFPSGFTMSVFADDSNPLDIADSVVSEIGVDVNGNVISWSSPQVQEITIALVPNSEEEKNMSILLEANTAKRGRRPAGDILTIVQTLPNGTVVTARNGKLLSGSRGFGIESAGRLQTKTFVMAFGDFDVVRG